MQWRLLLILALMVVVVVFSLANSAPVDFRFLTYETKVSLALIMIVSALVGAIAGVLAGLASQLRLTRRLAEKEQEIRELKRQQANQLGQGNQSGGRGDFRIDSDLTDLS